MSLEERIPFNIEAEKTLLGILLTGDKAAWDEVSAKLGGDDFFQSSHKAIFKVISKLYQGESCVDGVTVGEALSKSGELESIGGVSYLGDLMHGAPTNSNIKSYIEILREKSILRSVIKTSRDFIDMASKQRFKDVNSFLDNLESQILSLGNSRSGSELMPISSLVTPGLKHLEELCIKKESTTGLSSGYPEIDKLTSGFQNSELIILAARPSMGKTALALNISLHLALKGKKIAFFSLEMGKSQILMRLLSTLAQVNLSKLISGELQGPAWSRIVTAASRLDETALFIDDSSPISPYEVMSKARRMKSKEGLDFIVIDYLQLMNLSRDRESREREVSEMSRLLKSFSKELDIPILTLSQLNRSVESRNNRRPVLSDLRESGAIEQDADLIAMLYREDYYEKENPTNEAEVIINKHRNGPTGTVNLRWVGEYGMFQNKT